MHWEHNGILHSVQYDSMGMKCCLHKLIDDFKDNGYFVYAAEMDGQNYKDVDYANKVLLVIGSEGNGVGRLVKKNCDFIAKIPMYGTTNSLNASVAAGIMIYEVVRNRK